jgi:hypothetical protein
MMSSNQGTPPALLSDHPEDATRLQAQLPDDVPRYQKARQQGRHPGCTPPET